MFLFTVLFPSAYESIMYSGYFILLIICMMLYHDVYGLHKIKQAYVDVGILTMKYAGGTDTNKAETEINKVISKIKMHQMINDALKHISIICVHIVIWYVSWIIILIHGNIIYLATEYTVENIELKKNMQDIIYFCELIVQIYGQIYSHSKIYGNFPNNVTG